MVVLHLPSAFKNALISMENPANRPHLPRNKHTHKYTLLAHNAACAIVGLDVTPGKSYRFHPR